MIASVTTHALDAAARVRDARGERALRHAVDGFVGSLGVLPDAPPRALSGDDIRSIRGAAESVIDYIEARVEQMPAASARRLVAAVYEIRRLLEELDRWERHFVRPAIR